MIRKAICSCGHMGIAVEGNPVSVVACNCLKCQRRTGSVFGVSSYFADIQIVERMGTSKSLTRTSEAGLQMQRCFCPECGSTVYWKPDLEIAYTGVAVGAFADPEFPEPGMALWNQSKHSWVNFPAHWQHSQTQQLADK